MSPSRMPPLPEPEGAGDLPEVFAQLTGIDVVDGELIPRSSPVKGNDLPGPS